MLKKISEVLSADEILDRAIKKAKKIQIYDTNSVYRKKKILIAKIDEFSTYIITTLDKYIKEFPSLDNISPFFKETIDIKIDINKLKKSLGAINWAKNICQSIYSKQSKSLKKTQKIDFLKFKQKEIYGRISSVIRQIGKDLIFLNTARREINALPDIKEIPTIVIAGYPNVGKSSLLRNMSSATPLIAKYPFTTKEIYLGHISKKEKYINKTFQIIDTPGLLDRPTSKKNNIEKQAIAALKYLADIIVFIIDPSETCGYSLFDQNNLLETIKDMFNTAKIIVVENKVDVKKLDSKNLQISCETGEGIDNLIEKIFSYNVFFNE